ncbi:MAG TPA: hypothetical protein VGS14_02195 [Actinomycetes bacterium]|jgi:3-isopropylmalate dehydrogenase|nr:hypothetical protein [Actinomycetes bacterium]
MMLSSALLLGWLDDRHADPGAAAAARLIEQAVADTLAAGVRTRDLGGPSVPRALPRPWSTGSAGRRREDQSEQAGEEDWSWPRVS